MAPTVRSLLVAVAGASAIAFACSSVPDVQFVDGGETTSASSSGTSGEPPPPPPDWACPDSGPPEGSGVCCGNLLCLKCTASDCSKCEQEGCAGTLSAACCRRNANQFDCRAHDQCL